MMDVAKLREEFRSAPDWAFIGLMTRLAALEAEVEELEKPKKRAPRKKVNGNK